MIAEVEEMPAAPAKDSEGGPRAAGKDSLFDLMMKLAEVGMCMKALGRLGRAASEDATAMDVGMLAENLGDQQQSLCEALHRAMAEAKKDAL